MYQEGEQQVQGYLPIVDLAPTITIAPTSFGVTTPTYSRTMRVVIRVDEIYGYHPTNGSTIELRIPRTNYFSNINYSPTATSVGGVSVNNSAWVFDNSDSTYYIWRTNSVIGGFQNLKLGFLITFTAPDNGGTLFPEVILLNGSGGEVFTSNNYDNERFDYFRS